MRKKSCCIYRILMHLQGAPNRHAYETDINKLDLKKVDIYIT